MIDVRRDVLSPLSLPFNALGYLRPRRYGRRLWVGHGRAHIEVRGVHRVELHEMTQEVERVLTLIEGVDWARVNAVLGRVIVSFDDGAVSLDDLCASLEEVETQYGVGADDGLADAILHPGEPDTIRFSAIEFGADLVGISLGLAFRLVRLPMLPIEIAASASSIDALPPVRRVLEAHRGLEAAVVSTSAVFQGLAQGPAGLITDAMHRGLLLREGVSRQRLWERIEPDLAARGAETIPAFARAERPVPVPDGLLERYARTVSMGSIGLAGAMLALTRDPRRTVDVLLAGVPRAGRLGREAFGAHVGYLFAQRGILVMDPAALRRLDRIDTVVVDDEVLGPDHDGSEVLVAAIHDAAQDLVLARSSATRRRPKIHVDLTVTGGDELAESVRALQGEGRVVALVSRHAHGALAAADCGIGLTGGAGVPPWGAHVLCPTMQDAALVVDATAAARAAGRRVVTVAAGGSGLAGALALTAARNPGRRVVLTMNAAALGAIAAGLWTGQSLSGRRPPPRASDGTAWHALDPDVVIARLASTRNGLVADEASIRRRAGDAPRPPSLGSILLSELANPLSLVLAAGGVLSTVAGSVADGLLITGVLGLNGLVGAVQRQQAARAIDDLAAAIPGGSARVRRDDEPTDVAPEELVTGDLLVLQAGDLVAADARIVSGGSVEADESSLTGESLPVIKAVDPVATEAAVADRASMLYAGTAIAAGRVEAVVVAIDGDTEARRGVDGVLPPQTGVEARLDELMRRTVPVTLAAGGLLAGSSLLRGVPWRDAVSTGVSLAAAAVPEGLPFLATVAQAAAARRLAQRGVLVRNARVLESLGRVEVLCFDKTGTLTEGRLQVRLVSDGDVMEPVAAMEPGRRRVLAAALRATPRRRGETLPHPTDQAIVDAAAEIGVRPRSGADGWKKTVSLPFSSTRGYHAVLGRVGDGSRLAVKGAPEVVLPRCDTWKVGDDVVELTDVNRGRLSDHVEQLANDGLRVLAVAERPASGREDLDDPRVARLELLGFVAVADVTRVSAAAPIAALQRAGISVVMLTGDHPSTARAIARELGLVDGDIVTGPALDAMPDAELDGLLARASVFARVTPAHKVRIVAGYRRIGRVVAMTGDGANDAQAIRLADTGIAFGPRATDAARSAADLVIADGRLEAVIDAIVEGRSMWASVRDALALLLGGNLGEVLFTTGGTLIGGRSPLNARQLLAVNLLTDLAPALAIALQRRPAEGLDLRYEGPETSLGKRLTRDIAVRAGATAAATAGAWTIARFTGTPTRASSVALVALVGAQLGQTVVVGYRSPLVLASCAVSVAALVTIVETPGLSRLFGCRPLGPVGWSIAAGSAALGTAGAIVAGRLMHRMPTEGPDEAPLEIDLRDDEPAAARPISLAAGA